MEIKTDTRVIIMRMIFIAIIILCIYNFNINPALFGFIIALSTIYIIFSGVYMVIVTDEDIEFTFKRLLPLFTKSKKIAFTDIKSIELIERGYSALTIILNQIIFVPGNTSPADYYIIYLHDGTHFEHQCQGSRKEHKKAVELVLAGIHRLHEQHHKHK
jgi:hypothetical protein